MKSRIAFLLVVCLLFALCSGCGAGTASAPESASAPAESVQEAPAAEASAAQEAPPVQAEEPAAEASAAEEPPEEPAEPSAVEEEPAEEEPEAEEYTYMFPLDEPVTLSYMNTFNPSMMTFMDGQQDVAPEIEYEKMTNVHIDYMNLSPDVFMEQFNMALVTDDLPDFIQDGVSYYTGGGANAVEEGYFANLAEHLEHMPNYAANIEANKALKKTAYSADGVIAAQYTVMEANNVNGVIVRQDWLDQLGMDAPRTYDDIENVLKAMKSDLGVEYPLILPLFLDYQYNMFSGNFGIPGSFDLIGMSQQLYVVDGEVRYAQYQPEYEEYVRLIAHYYDEKLLDPDFVGYEMVRDYQDKINNGQVGLYLNSTTNLKDTTDAMAETGAVWAGIHTPVKEDGQINHFTTYAETVSTFGAVSIAAKCENIDVACEWLDYKGTPEIEHMFDFGIEGQTYNYDADGNVVWTDLILNNPDGMTVTQAMTMYTGSDMGTSKRQQTMYTDYQKAAVEAWTTDVDGDYVFPKDLVLNPDESSEASALLGDIRTHISQASLQFVVGDRSLDEFQAFRDELQSMGMDRVLEIYQAAYTKYLED